MYFHSIRFRRDASTDAQEGLFRVCRLIGLPVMLIALLLAFISDGTGLMQSITNNTAGALILLLGLPTVAVFARIDKRWLDSVFYAKWIPSGNEWRGSLAVLTVYFGFFFLTTLFVQWLIHSVLSISLASWPAMMIGLAGAVIVTGIPFIRWNSRSMFERVYYLGYNWIGQPYGWWGMWDVDLASATATHRSGLRVSFERVSGMLNTITLNHQEWEASQRFRGDRERQQLLNHLLHEASAVFVVYLDTKGKPWWTESPNRSFLN